MDLRAYLDILRRRGWIIIVVAVLASARRSASASCRPRYTAPRPGSARCRRAPTGAWANSAKDLLRNFVNNIKTHDMANQVIASGPAGHELLRPAGTR